MRFLDNMGLEYKISMQRKELNKEMKKESRMKGTEMIKLVDEDYCDLMEIVNSSNIKMFHLTLNCSGSSKWSSFQSNHQMVTDGIRGGFKY